MIDMEISDSIRYIGCDDPDLDLFESQYIVPEGVSYNSYLILDDKVCVMDTVDGRCVDQWLKNLDEALGGRTPDYLVISHMEPDHCAGIAAACERYPQMQILCTALTEKMIPQFFEGGVSNEIRAVTDNDTVELGDHKLEFFTAPMVHWPEVMVSYEHTEKILFSADGFGKFGALCYEEPYDPNGEDKWSCEARRYYINICGKFGSAVQALLQKASTLDIKMICPLHGPILRTNLGFFIDRYQTWSTYTPEEEGILIAYASIHGHTVEVAKHFAEILKKKGATNVELTDLARDDQAEAVEDAFRLSHLVLAGCSYDARLFPPMEHYLCHLRDKDFQNRTVGIIENGSFAPSAARVMKGYLDEMKDLTICDTVVTIMSSLHSTDEEALEKLADELLAN